MPPYRGGATMTTNVIDFHKALIACDSRWSALLGNEHFVYLDDTGFDKIVVRDSLCAIFAGDLILIDGWKNWICSQDAQPALPDTTRTDLKTNTQVFMQVCLIDRANRQAKFYGAPYQALASGFFFGGTGAAFAMQCFLQNQCSKRAVESAALGDVYTGGATLFFELETSTNNLSKQQVTLKELEAQILPRGMVMHKQTKNVTTLKEFQQKPEAGSLLNGFSLSAPCGGPQRAWSQMERDDAEQFVRFVVQRDKQKKSDAAND